MKTHSPKPMQTYHGVITLQQKLLRNFVWCLPIQYSCQECLSPSFCVNVYTHTLSIVSMKNIYLIDVWSIQYVYLKKYWTSKIRNRPSHPVLSKTNAQRLSAAGSTKTYVGALGQPWRYLGPVEAWVVNFAMGTVEPSPPDRPFQMAELCGL